jgi:hypothetical protein
MNRMLPTSLLGFLALSLAVLFAYGCSGNASTDAAAGAFNPDRYRAGIESVEAVLYQSTPPDHADLDRAESALRDLHSAVLSREKDPRVRDKAHDLLFVTSETGFTDAGYVVADLGPVRARWEAVRLDLFGYAEWFRQTTPEVRSAQQHPKAELNSRYVRKLRGVVDRLEELIVEGHRECDVLGEPCYAPGRVGREGEQQIAGWRRFQRSWDGRLTRAAEALPPAPAPDGVIDYVTAYQSVTAALSELRVVAVGAGEWATPFRYQWEQRFNTARSHLSEARTDLERLPNS